jgi:hypothetical protein
VSWEKEKVEESREGVKGQGRVSGEKEMGRECRGGDEGQDRVR